MTALEDFEKYLIDEERFSPVTVHHTIQKLSYIFQHIFMDYNYRYDNKYYVNDVIVIDKFINNEVI